MGVVFDAFCIENAMTLFDIRTAAQYSGTVWQYNSKYIAPWLQRLAAAANVQFTDKRKVLCVMGVRYITDTTQTTGFAEEFVNNLKMFPYKHSDR